MRRGPVLVALVVALALAVPVGAGAAGANAYRKGLVRAGDLPAGWTASAAETTGDAAAARAIADCVGKPGAQKKSAKKVKKVKKKVVTGDDIADPTGNFSVASTVAVYPSRAVARRQFAVYRSPKYPDCAKKHFETTPWGKGGPLATSVIADEVEVDRSGDRSVAHEAQAVIPKPDGTSFTITSIQVWVLRGKAIAGYQFNSVGDEGFDQDAAQALLEVVDRRLDRARL